MASIRDAAGASRTVEHRTGGMRLGRYRFRPSLWPSLAVLLLLPLLLALGFWQLDRAEQKRDWLARQEAALQQDAVNLNAIQPDYQSVAHHRAQAGGRYDAAHQILLDNQVRDRQQGYLVLTPLRLAGTEQAILVDRGWMPASLDRSQLPDIALTALDASVQGIIDQGPSAGLKLGPAASDTSWPQRLQYLDFELLAQQLPYPLLPYVLRLDPDQPQGYRRDWQPVTEMAPATHIGYAVQWFGLALALVVIYIVVNTRRVERAARD